MTGTRAFAWLAWGSLAVLTPGAWAGDDAAAIEFFEAKVRPVLVARCQSCHGGEKSKGGLRLETKAEALTGGLTGPAIVPGKPTESLLVEAINYGDALQMPPKSKLPPDEIATLTRWVEQGAPWPVDRESSTGARVKPFDLKERSKHWSLQPVGHPAIPKVNDESWPINPIDRFLLARLEAKGLKPASEADKRTLIRRLSFDLIGLPPRPDEVHAFLVDSSPDAYEKLVERLLASPHYGERWARHWLDLVRYAETSGHEFDYEIPLAYRYRDYVIKALNDDVPYNQFVVEHLAGDLLPEPRRDSKTGTNESVLGTGFFRLHEGVHSPVDLKEDVASKIDNQVDVLSKTFLGLTVACARCHDHKFDAITTRDYYALNGILASSRHTLAFLDPPTTFGPKLAELEAIRNQVASRYQKPAASTAKPKEQPSADIVFEDFNGPTYANWFVSGEAFGNGPTQPNSWRIQGNQVEALEPGVAHSGAISDRLRGVLRSKTFTLTKPYVHYLASGRGGRINVVIDGFEKIRAPIYGDLVHDIDHQAPHWNSIDVAQWVGHHAYIEIDDGATVDFTGGQTRIRNGGGYIAVDEIRFADGPAPSVPPRTAPDSFGPEEQVREIQPLLAKYREIEATLPEPTLGQAMTDGNGLDARVQIRGSTKTLGEVAPRRFLEVFTDGSTASPTEGSGRLELARRIVEPTNPLTARVMVNRLWHHHFGRGIVASLDDFGAMGRQPTHPELLDDLARQFIASGWSIKAMHRLMVTSRAYRMSSQLTPEADKLDPSNELWHRREVRRLEAESIRDAVLAVSGRLDPKLYGPSVAPHLTSFMEGRGRPGHSGPLDGDGRRSLYINVRRNFLTPMLLAFDFPTPSSTMGRRNVSNVPAQALTLMNDPFLVGQAKVWATRIRQDPRIAPQSSIETMYLEAFGRPPADDERTAALGFLEEQARAYGKPDDLRAWADLAHVLFNVKEFVTVP